jgi:hypothetical protein
MTSLVSSRKFAENSIFGISNWQALIFRGCGSCSY